MNRRMTDDDYRVDAVTAAKALVGAWLCRRLESDGARFRFTAAPRIGIAYASKRDQNRKWRFTLK
jgi:3-methyladenine DNA glycosylase Mpg